MAKRQSEMVSLSRFMGSFVRGALSRFARDRRGNVSVIVVFSILPMLICVGGGLDVVRTYNVRVKMQADLDAALVAAVRELGTSDEAKIQTKVRQWFEAQTAANDGAYTLGAITIDKANQSISAKASGSVGTSLMSLINVDELPIDVRASVRGPSTSYLNVYIVVDNSPSMLLAATKAEQDRMQAKIGCAFACHTPEGTRTVDGITFSDNYTYSQAAGIRLRSDVAVDAATKVIDLIDVADKEHRAIKVGLYTVGDAAKQVLAPTFSTATARTKLKSKTDGMNGATASTATYFDKSLPQLQDFVGTAGDGKTADQPLKLVLFLTDGVQSQREWVSTNRWIGRQVAPLNPAWCAGMKTNKATLGVLYTEYLPMTWDWGYNATVGNSMAAADWNAVYGGVMRSGVPGSTTRQAYLPYALEDCSSSKDLFISAASPTAITTGLAKIFNTYLGTVRLTQ